MTSSLVIVNTVIFGFQAFLQWALPGLSILLQQVFALSIPGIREGFWWQFVTHAFLHGNFLHLLVNVVGLWFAGRLVERVIGPWRLLLLYVFAAISGGVLQMALGGNAMLLGASGAVCGIIVAFCAIFPNREVLVFLFFILPIQLRAKFIGWGLVLSSLFFLVFHLEPWIGHAAHLGGCIGGFLFVRLAGFARPSRLECAMARRSPYPKTSPRR